MLPQEGVDAVVALTHMRLPNDRRLATEVTRRARTHARSTLEHAAAATAALGRSIRLNGRSPYASLTLPCL